MAQPITASSKKRKRATADQNADGSNAKRASLARNGDQLNGVPQTFNPDDFVVQQLQNATHEMSNTAAAALGANPLSPDTQGLSFGSNGTSTDQAQPISSFDMADPSTQPTHSSPYVLPPGYKAQDDPPPGSSGQDSANGTSNKPVSGTPEWHKLRRDNHKEVERRRREAINEGINALGALVPNCEKNKGSILQKAVSYINELRAQAAESGQRKVMEKTVLDQAVHELTAINSNLQDQMRITMEKNERLEMERERLERENERFRMKIKELGISSGKQIP